MCVYTAATIAVPRGISNTQGRFPVASAGGKYMQTSYYPQNKEEKINTDHQHNWRPGTWELAQEIEDKKNRVRFVKMKAKGTLHYLC